jgi:peptide-methionine (S)-S-oxide reductase
MDHGKRESPDKGVATLGGGCFWCLEPIFKDLTGVEGVIVGYSGGTVPNPSYEQVCTGKTGHAEVVQISFDPGTISFTEILEVFFSAHDPTTPNRQGGDVGPQYRSIIFYHSQEQKEKAERVIEGLNASRTWKTPIVTEVVPFKEFYKAEAYHQDYFAKNPRQAYCQVVIAPKVEKFQKQYSPKLKKGPGKPR